MRRKKRGFTLVEILIALVVLSVGTSFLVATFTAGIKGMASSKNKTIATNLARDLLDEVMGKAFENPGGGTAMGPDVGEDNRQLYNDVDDYTFWGPHPPKDYAESDLMQYASFSRSARVCYVAVDNLDEEVDLPTPFKKVTVTVKHGGIRDVVLTALKTTETYYGVIGTY